MEEVEEEEEVIPRQCRDCGVTVPHSDKKTKRPKRCKACMAKREKESRIANPGRHLGLKMRVQRRKRGLVPDDEKDLYTNESARAIYDMYNGKSYLSAEDNVQHLCIASKVKKPKSRDDFVLLTTKEATTLACKKTDEEKAAFLEKNKYY